MTRAGQFASDIARAGAGLLRDTARTTALFCPVCFGASDSPMAHALNWGVLSLLAVTVVVLATFGTFFIRLAKRARAVHAREAQS